MNKMHQAFDPGKGYRLVSIGESLEDTDQYQYIDGDGWKKFKKWGHDSTVTDPEENLPCPFGFYRRKI